jgi:aryl-alcohol dehydrogenase-like predicted oxidoreductase
MPVVLSISRFYQAFRGSFYAMRKRKLGRTGYHLTEVAFGAAGLGSPLWRGVDASDAQRALYQAVDAGINFIDTSAEYGDSERLIGQVVGDLRARDSVVVATKVAPLAAKAPAGELPALADVFPSAYVVRSVEDSLRRQRAEVLSIVQLTTWRDSWHAGAAWRDLAGTMHELIRAGKVLHWGISVSAAELGAVLPLLDDPVIETVQMPYSIFTRAGSGELMTRARERDVGVLVRSPLEKGALGGAFTMATTFLPGDVRAEVFAGPRLAEVVDRVGQVDQVGRIDRLGALRSFLGDEAATLAELALRFCLSSPDIAAVVTGMRRAEHVAQNLAVSDGRPLSPDTLERLREHAWERAWAI